MMRFQQVCSLVGPILISILALQLVATATAAQSKKPNIILILSDDVGLGNIGCYGGAFETPNIDALAKSGTKFNHCYSTPLCGPSRCQLLTGRYPFRTGHNSNQSRLEVSPDDEVMMPTMLKTAGYKTAQAGKWGQIQLGPGEWGFDEYLVYPGSGRFWRAQTDFYTKNGKRESLPKGKYLPEIMHNFVVDFIEKNKEQPFFVYYSMSHMHGPIVRTPQSKDGADAEQLYIDNNGGMDDYVGRLVKELERIGVRDNTILIFTADNGTARQGVKLAKVDGKPISGQKASMLEGGSCVPLVVSWPAGKSAGKVNNDLVDFTDFFATFADVAGAAKPDGVTLDGVSFAPQLRGEEGTPREFAYVELNGKSFARDDKFKLTNQGLLYDVTKSPFEEKAVADDSTDADAVAARKSLQMVLDEHKALPGHKVPPKNKRAMKNRRRAARARQNEEAAPQQ